MRRASSLIAFAIIVGGIPLTASADSAFTLRDVDVFTGPGSEYPPVATLPPNTGVDVAGCLSDWSWCDVIFSDSRGWVYAGDLGYPYQNNRVAIIEYGPRLHIPVVAFSLPTYWDAHYRGRPWYRERDVWVNRVHAQIDRGGRSPEGRAGRAASSAGGAPSSSPSARVATPPQQESPQTGQQPQYIQPRQPGEAMQRPNAPETRQPQQSPTSPQQNSATPDTRAREATPRSSQTTPPGQTMQPPHNAPSAQSPSASGARAPDSRPAAGSQPEGRPPEARPSESQWPREAGPSADRGQGKGPPSDRGEREGNGPPQGRGGDNSPDRDRQ